jgi:hypothetical protein
MSRWRHHAHGPRHAQVCLGEIPLRLKRYEPDDQGRAIPKVPRDATDGGDTVRARSLGIVRVTTSHRTRAIGTRLLRLLTAVNVSWHPMPRGQHRESTVPT